MNELNIDYSKLPKSLQGGVKRYIENGIVPGGFLRAVACNDLTEAVARADENNYPLLKDIVLWFYNEAPSACWGSPEKVKKWADMKYEERVVIEKVL